MLLATTLYACLCSVTLCTKIPVLEEEVDTMNNMQEKRGWNSGFYGGMGKRGGEVISPRGFWRNVGLAGMLNFNCARYICCMGKVLKHSI